MEQELSGKLPFSPTNRTMLAAHAVATSRAGKRLSTDFVCIWFVAGLVVSHFGSNALDFAIGPYIISMIIVGSLFALAANQFRNKRNEKYYEHYWHSLRELATEEDYS